jgi:hypothetical protein
MHGEYALKHIDVTEIMPRIFKNIGIKFILYGRILQQNNNKNYTLNQLTTVDKIEWAKKSFQTIVLFKFSIFTVKGA